MQQSMLLQEYYVINVMLSPTIKIKLIITNVLTVLYSIIANTADIITIISYHQMVILGNAKVLY